MPLTATIEVPPQIASQPFHVALRIVNPSEPSLAILNPDMGVPSPAMKWPWSNQAYQTSLLISFGYLSVSVVDDTGRELPQETLQTWATPVLRPRIELAAGDSVEVSIPIGDFYQLESGRSYSVSLEYGDRDLKVAARARVQVP
jgi:hypothetical protein